MMKRIFLVKRDPARPAAEDNWIRMDYRRFMEFLETPDGQLRRNSFAIIDGCCSGDSAIVIEADRGSVEKITSERNRSCYLRRTAALADEIYGLSAEDEEEEEDCTGGRRPLYLPDDSVSVEDAVEKRMMTERMKDAFRALEDEEKLLITCCLLREDLTEETYARAAGMSRDEVNLRKRRILTKLRKGMCDTPYRAAASRRL